MLIMQMNLRSNRPSNSSKDIHNPNGDSTSKKFAHSDLTKAYLQSFKHPGRLPLYGLTASMLDPLYDSVSQAEKDSFNNGIHSKIMSYLSDV